MVSIVVFRGEPEKNIHFEIRVRLTPSTLGLKILMKTLFSAIFGKLLHFIIDGREPKLFDFKSSSQQQSWSAHKIGQLCHQNQPATCPSSQERDRAKMVFKLALNWLKAGKSKIGSLRWTPVLFDHLISFEVLITLYLFNT